MCVLIFKPADKDVDEKLLRNAWKWNNDGGGIAYLDYEAGKLVIKKGFEKLDEFIDVVKNECSGRDSVIHLRRASVGMVVNAKNCHPFSIRTHPNGTNLEDPNFHYRYQYAVAHNGRLPVADTLKHSDTSCFVHNYLSPAFTSDPDMMIRAWFVDMMSEILNFRTLENKLVIMKYDAELNKGYVRIIGENKGKWFHGCWFSNEEPWKKDTATTYNNAHIQGEWDDFAGPLDGFTPPKIDDVWCYGNFFVPKELKPAYDNPDENGWYYIWSEKMWHNAISGAKVMVLPEREDPEQAAIKYRTAVYDQAKEKWKKEQEEKKKAEEQKNADKGKRVFGLKDEPQIGHLTAHERKLIAIAAKAYAKKSKWQTDDPKNMNMLETVMWLRSECRTFIEDCKELDWLELDCWIVAKIKQGVFESIIVDAANADHDATIKAEEEAQRAEIIPINIME